MGPDMVAVGIGQRTDFLRHNCAFATDWSVASSSFAIEWSKAVVAATDWSVASSSSSATEWSVASSSSSSFVAVDWSNADAVAVTDWSVTSSFDDDDEAWEVIEWSIISDCETIKMSTEWDLEGVDDLDLGSNFGGNKGC
jgi:hypothetical protein